MPAERRSRVIHVRGYDDDDESSEDDRSDVFSDPNHNKPRYYQGCSDSEESDTESSDYEDKGPRYWCLSTSISMSGYFTLLDDSETRNQ